MIRIPRSSTLSEYAQIAREIRLKLVDGDYKPGDQLPTVRQLAQQLRVNHNTVAAAYRMLAAEGWIDLRRRRGAIVLDRRAPRPSRRDLTAFRAALDDAVAEARSEGIDPLALATVLQKCAAELAKPKRRSS